MLTTIFWIALVGGLFFFALSHFMGDFGGHDGDFGGGHDVGHDGDGDDGAFIANLFTLRNLFLFAVGFGAAGAIAENLKANDTIATLWAIGGGLLLALAGAWLFGQLRSQQANSLTRIDNLVGKQATVTTPIPSDGRGEISTLNTQGVRTTLTARSESGGIPAQTIVTILSVTADVATVAPVS